MNRNTYRTRKTKTDPMRHRRRFFLEPLEDRRLLSTITVNTLVDEFGSTDQDTSLRDAIAKAAAGDTIDFSVTGTINLTLGPVALDNLILDGPGATLLTINGNQMSGVFTTSGTTTIEGVTITGGKTTLGGGGINNLADGILTVKDSVVTGNLALGGGGIYTGGYIGGPYSQLTVDNSTISDNTVLDPREGGGGPYYFYGRGGGIAGFRSDITVDNSTISGNSAKFVIGSSSEGGGIFGGTATISNSTISGNTADKGGGVYSFGFLAITNSTIYGNVGLQGKASMPTLYSGGILCRNGPGAVVANSTITGNNVGINAVGATLTNSIVSGNGVGGNLINIVGSLNAATSRNNLIDNAAYAGGLTNGVNGNVVGVADPGLGALANNGGPTETCALLSYSPAINAGDNSLIPIDPSTGSPFTTDQTGAPRIFNGTVDIGAVEFQATPHFVSTVVNTTADDVSADALTSLREAIAFAGRSGGVVTFDPTVFATPQTITLTEEVAGITGGYPGQLFVNSGNGAVTIAGPGAGLLTVQGEPGSPVFLVTGSSPATISGMTITGAPPGFGDAAGILDKGNLTLASSVVTGNTNSGIINDGALTVSYSNISGNTAPTGDGGGIFNKGTATISNSTISGNTTEQIDGRGGGIANFGVAAISNSTISGNTAQSGGGISNVPFIGNLLPPTLTISDSTISGNTVATRGERLVEAKGGGISNGGTATISDSTISGNTANAGGGIANFGVAAISDSTISGNTTDTYGGQGGGIYNGGTATISNSTISGSISHFGGGIYNGGAYGGTATISDSTISGNTAATSHLSLIAAKGGGIYNEGGRGRLPGGTATISDSTISGNSAGVVGGGTLTYLGGGIYNGGTATISDSTISGNTASTGGGIYNRVTHLSYPAGPAGTATISDSTISGNSAGVVGGGVFSIISGGATATIVNSIVAGNLGSEGSPSDIPGGSGSNLTAASAHNLIGDAATAGGLVNGVNGNIVGVDPLLGPLADNGGPTQTMALLAGSPAIDKGDNTLVPIDPSTGLPVTTDQRGFTRVVNGSVDIGAFEDQVVVTTPADAQATTAGSVATVGLGSFADSAINAGNSTVVVDFGDGSPTMTLLNVAPGSLGSVTHTFTSNGTYTVTVTATDQFSDANLGTLAVVVAAPTAISVSASSATPAFGQPETLTATVTTPSGDPIPTSSDGMVTFYDGTTALGSATLSGSPAIATLTIPAGLAVGSHTITASYSGDDNFAASRSGVESASAQLVVPATGLNLPYGVAVDGSGDVFIVDIDSDQAVEMKADGTQTTVGSGLFGPRGAAVDGSGDLFIADLGNNRVVKVKPDGTQTTVGTGLSLPFGAAVDGSGEVFIADAGNNRVVEVKPDGTQTTVGTGLSVPISVAVDGNGDLFIADFGNNRVVEVNAGGMETTVASGFNEPRGVAVDGSGDIFIADTGNNQVVEVKSDGTRATIGSGLSGPASVAVDGSGDLFIADTGNSRVVKVTAGVPVTVSPAPTSISVSAAITAPVYGQTETFTATVTTPSGAATPTSSDGTVIFYDGTTALGSATLSGSPATAALSTTALAAGSHTITASYSGDSLFVASRSGIETTSVQSVVGSGLIEPAGVAVDATRDVFIADPFTNQVVEVKADGTQTTVGSGLNLPSGVAVDGTDVFIADTGNNRVVEVKADGTQTTVGSGFSEPFGVAVDGTDVFIADTGNNRVVEVKADGTQTTFGSGFSEPSGVAVDGLGDVFIADTGNRRVVEMKADGTQTTVGSGLFEPAGVAVDATGDVFFADGLHNVVVEVKADGTQTAFGFGVSSPFGVAADGTGDLFFADAFNNRVVKVAAGVPVTVSQATPTASVNPVNITYGTALSNTQLSGTATWSVGGNPVTVTGTFTYTTAAGTVLGAGTGQSEAVTFTPSDSTDYTTASTTVTINVAQAGTTTALSSSMNPTVHGQAATFTATVASAVPLVGPPTGSVTFFAGATTLGSAPLSAGVASLAVTTLTIGSDQITAVYSGDTNFTRSPSTALSQTVEQDGTTTAVVSSANPSVFGQSVTFTATVSPTAPGSGTPTGTVIFIDGSTVLGSPTLSGGVATYTTSILSVSNHRLQVVYGGDSNFTGSPSSVLTETVTKDATTTSVASAANPSVFGQSVTFTATVSAGAPGSGTPTGTVTFKDGSTTLGRSTLTGGSATFTSASLAVATHSITASYGGDGDFTSSASATLSDVVNQAGSTTSLVSAINPSVSGQPVTFTVTVMAAAPASGTPTGTVSFFDGTTSLGSAALHSGTASFTARALPTGGDSITASYGGSGNFTPSTSPVLDQTVNQAGTTTAVVSSTNPSIFGQSVTFTATVAAMAPGSGTPTGTVTFLDGANALGTATLANGRATLRTTVLAAGSHTITVSYGGDSNFLTGTSLALTQTINQSDTTSKVTSSDSQSVYGESVTFTATVKAVAPGSGTPSGTVSFLDGSTRLGTGTLSGGTATFSISTLAVATHSITVVYSGDANFLTSPSGVLTQTVKQAATTSSVSSSANPSVSGQGVTFTATIAPVSPGSGTPTGTVTFDDGSTVLATVTLTNGSASFTTSTLAVGTHSIKIVYAGDTNFKTSTSAVLRQVVNSSSDVVVAFTIAPGLVDQALSVLSDETLPDALVTELTALQLPVTWAKGSPASVRR